MSTEKLRFQDIPKEDLLGIINSIPDIHPSDEVTITSHDGITCMSFENTSKNKTLISQQRLLEELANNHENLLKYIVMGRNDEYHEIGNYSMRPFRTIREAILYGETLITKNHRIHSGYHSYIIQPLLEGIDSFQLTIDQIKFICQIEKK